MSTVISHALVGVTIGVVSARTAMTPRFWILTALCATLPDLDGLGLRLGIPYDHLFGHRGFGHSLCFATLLALLVTRLGFAEIPRLSSRWWRLWLYFTMVAASHGITDAMTDGGLGVAFFSPFVNTRYFLPWRPLVVPPVQFFALFSSWGMEVLVSELLYLWLPSLLLLTSIYSYRRLRHA